MLVLLLLSALFLGQTASSFEVASIKPAESITPAMVAAGKLHVGMSVDGARVDIGYLSLGELIPIAFNVKPYQVQGPDWLRSQRFDILAKMPEGATKEQVPALLQKLLEERFKLKAHRESRDNPIFALVVGKDGPKMKEAPPDPDAPLPGDAPAAGLFGTSGSQVQVSAGRGGATVVSPDLGTAKFVPGPDGMRMEIGKLSMSRFADMLTALVERPVVDMTGLKGNYEVALDLPLDVLLNVARASGIAPGLAAGRGATATDPSSSSIFTSVQQLGLRLESRRAPVDFVVIDSVEKMPTEN